MRRLKSSQSKTSSSTMTMIAAKMDGQDWWKQTIYEFTREMPCKEQWSEKIGSYMEGLDEVKLDKSGVEYLHSVVKDMHFIMDGFRPKSIEDVTKKVCATCKRLSASATAEKVGASPEEDDDDGEETVLLALEAAMQEASSLMPEAKGLAEAVCKVNESMRCKKQAGQAKTLLDGCRQLLDLGAPSAKNLDELRKQVGTLNDLCLALLKPLAVESEEKLTVEKTRRRLVEIYAACYMSDEEELVGLNQMINLVCTLPHLLSTVVPDAGRLLECLFAGQEFLEKARHVLGPARAVGEAQAGAATVENLRSVRRLQIQVQHSQKTWSEVEQICDECKQAWEGFLTKYAAHCKVFTAMVAAVQGEATEAVQQATKDCQAVAGGKQNGALWTDGLKTSLKWSGLQLKFRDGLLFDVSAKQLAKNMDSLVEVCLMKDSTT